MLFKGLITMTILVLAASTASSQTDSYCYCQTTHGTASCTLDADCDSLGPCANTYAQQLFPNVEIQKQICVQGTSFDVNAKRCGCPPAGQTLPCLKVSLPGTSYRVQSCPVLCSIDGIIVGSQSNFCSLEAPHNYGAS